MTIKWKLRWILPCNVPRDHPWLKEHPEWFRFRPDGTIRFTENPPKKYEDIVNPDFNGDHRIALWEALRKVMLFWADQGVRIFRVDNPHTKPFPFWEWLSARCARGIPTSFSYRRPSPDPR